MSSSFVKLFSASCLALFLLVFCGDAVAAYYVLENKNDSVIGELQQIRAEYRDTLLDIARSNGLGYRDIKLVNPELDTWLPGDGREIVLPSQYILPQAPHNGIILNIPEMRLYYFPEGNKPGSVDVITYPLGVGREGWDTPYVDTHIIQKKKNPSWLPPDSIRQEHEAMGDPLPERIGPGPMNPLGNYALRLGLPGYLIHGTNKPYGIGMRVSHGCIRLYPEDIKSLFKKVKLGTPVHIVNQPYKVGQHEGKIYLEAHPFMQEDAGNFEDNLTSVVRMLVKITNKRAYKVDWELAKRVIHDMKGIPVVIGRLVQPPVNAIVENRHDDMLEAGSQVLKLRLETSLSAIRHGQLD
ncbi:MAG: L,D-transpeptidase family protein [Gammaproteobacteria bacterium]